MLCLDYAGIGRRIREKRKEKFLTQAELADRADTTSSHMSHIENNTTKLSLTLIVAIANHLDVSVDYLLGANLKHNSSALDEEIAGLLKDCPPQKLDQVLEIIKHIIRLVQNPQP